MRLINEHQQELPALTAAAAEQLGVRAGIGATLGVPGLIEGRAVGAQSPIDLWVDGQEVTRIVPPQTFASLRRSSR